MRAVPWATCLAALCACGDDNPTGAIPFDLGGDPFHVDIDLNSGLDQCTAEGTLHFTQSGDQLTGTLTGTRTCNFTDTDLTGSITSGTLNGRQLSFTAETGMAVCTFTGEEGRDGSNEELRGTVECHYGERLYTGLFVAFRDTAS